MAYGALIIGNSIGEHTSGKTMRGTAIGYGGQFCQRLQTLFGLIFTLFDRPGKALHPLGPPTSTMLSPSPSHLLPLHEASFHFIDAHIVKHGIGGKG